MRKWTALFLALAMVCALAGTFAFAETGDLARMSDRELTELFRQVKAEMNARGLETPADMSLRDGKYIVGEDILPGSYEIRCTETEGDAYGQMYSSLGSAYSGLEGSDSGLGGLMGALGGMMGTMIPLTVEILGDYGTVLKSMELKSGDSAVLTLAAGTALQITGGRCTLTER